AETRLGSVGGQQDHVRNLAVALRQQRRGLAHEEPGTGPGLVGDPTEDRLGPCVERYDPGSPRGRDRYVDPEAGLSRRGGSAAAVEEDRTPLHGYTEVCATPGVTFTASPQASRKDSSRGSTIAADRTRWWAGSTPGGVTPSSRSASAAFRSF